MVGHQTGGSLRRLPRRPAKRRFFIVFMSLPGADERRPHGAEWRDSMLARRGRGAGAAPGADAAPRTARMPATLRREASIHHLT